jgi:hypothetical protein
MQYIKRRRNLRMIMKILREDPLVQSCKYSHNRIRVIFKTGLRELWYHKPDYGPKYIPEEPFGKSPRVRAQKDQYGLSKKLYYIKYKDWKKACFFEQRMSLHRLMDRYLRDFEGDFYTVDDLYTDLEDIRSRTFILNNTLYLRGKIVPYGFRLAGLAGLYSRAREYWTAQYMIRCFRRCLKLHMEMNKITIMWWIFKLSGGKFVNPIVYMDIIRYFGLSGMSIADPSPTPSKAIAATLMGCTYHAPCSYPKLEEFLGTKFYPIERSDVVLLDNGFKYFYDGPDRGLGDVAIAWSSGTGDNFLPVCVHDKIIGNLVYRS